MSATRIIKQGDRPYWAASAQFAIDQETPITAFLKCRDLGAHTLLESVEGDEKVARFSFIGLGRLAVLSEHNGTARLAGQAGSVEGADPIDLLRAGRDAYRAAEDGEDALPYTGGPLGFFAYDWVRRLERLPSRHPKEGAPWYWSWPHTVLAFDHRRQTVSIFAQARPEEGEDFLRARVAAVVDRLRSPARPGSVPVKRLGAVTANMDMTQYRAMIERAREYIRAGDIFQVVLSLKLSCAVEGDPFSLYRRLRRINPSPYLVYMETPDRTLVGSSPELLVRVQDGAAEYRPIAGTRPRGASPAEDERLWQELRADEKERAEHVMLVDLGRNDLGRISVAGSVVVRDLMVREQYSHVMHMVSNVESRLKPGHDALDALSACFPAGTVTGAPKIRAMEIIDELELAGRGAYGGVVGYWSHHGSLDTCITIRTLEVREGRATVQAGGGIVADSDAEREHAEAMNKARALVNVLDGEEDWL